MKTVSIYGCPQIRVAWSVYRGRTDCLEDFKRDKVKVWGWLVGRDNAWPLSATVDVLGRVRFTLPPVIDPVGKWRNTRLTPGAYDLKLLWVKGHAVSSALVETGRRNYTEVRNALLLVDDDEHRWPLNGVLEVSSAAATYGYDGLDAWEMAVMHGDTILPKLEWIARLSKVVNGESVVDGGCDCAGWVD